MHPARSIILFTTLSGLGFGLLTFLCVGLPPVTGWPAVLMFGLGFALTSIGLLSSTFHLGHPERALKAFTQWRSSWLSREGWLSVLALAATGAYAALVIFADTRIAPLGWLAALLSLATVYATSMIYAQLKTVPRWNHWTTSVLFVGLSLAGGALLSGTTFMAIPLIVVMGVFQAFAWVAGDGLFGDSGSNMETATGLGRIGKVRVFEAPHTGGNYLTHEMVHVVARKHAVKLRAIAILLGFAVPAALLWVSLMPLSILAMLSHLTGMLVLRWLFFAEAEHVVGLYYGKR